MRIASEKSTKFARIAAYVKYELMKMCELCKNFEFYYMEENLCHVYVSVF